MFREAAFPYMSLSDLRSTLPFQSKGMIPLPIEESELDFVPLSVLDDEQNGKQLHGILVANALSISFEDAERIKNQIGLQNVTGDERLEKAEEAIRETTAQLIVGVRNKAMAKELGPSHIRVNCVAPGVIDTEMNAHLSQADMDALGEETPLGRIGRAEEAARAIFYLASEQSAFVTGQVLQVDGGMVI